MKRKTPQVTADLSPSLYKAFRHKVIEEDLTVKEAVRQLIELWVKEDIALPQKPAEPTRDKKPNQPA